MNVFVLSNNNEAKVPLKQMTKVLGNSTYNVSLKISLGRGEKFCLMKIDINSFTCSLPVLIPFLSISGQFFRGSSHLPYCLLAGPYSRRSI